MRKSVALLLSLSLTVVVMGCDGASKPPVPEAPKSSLGAPAPKSGDTKATPAPAVKPGSEKK